MEKFKPFSRQFLLLLCIPVWMAFRMSGDSIPLQDAVKKGIVKIKVHGIDMNDFTDDQVMQNKNLELELENTTASTVNIELPVGQLFNAEEDPFQNMITADQQLFVVEPGKKKKYPFKGYCIQAHDMGPGEGTNYQPAGMASGYLYDFAKYVDSKNLQLDYATQQAFWVLSDNNPIYYLDENKETQKYISLLTGKPVSERPKNMVGYRPPIVRSYTLKGQVDYNLNEPSKVTLAIYDSTGKELHAFLKDADKQRGKHWVKYTWTWREGSYKIRLIVNGVVKSEQPVLMRDED